MKHSVIFKNQTNKWDTALPLGNGVFGAMLFYEKNKLFMPMNHYEVYYNISKEVLPKDKLAAMPKDGDGKAAHAAVRACADINAPVGDELYSYFRYRGNRREDDQSLNAGAFSFSASYPCTGELVFSFDPALHGASHTLGLYTEDAKVTLKLEAEAAAVQVDTIVANVDCIVNRIAQSKQNLVDNVFISFPAYRDYDYPEIRYTQLAEDLFGYTVTRSFDPETSFVFSGVIRLLGAKGRLEEGQNGAYIRLTESEKDFTVLTGIFTQWHYEDTLKTGIAQTAAWADSLDNLLLEHKARWDAFFAQSSITLPDKFLEHVYYVNQYALSCCSGKDGVMKHHACGLNGLWAIRHPNLWGSMWYWDVNIQAAFAGVFSSNRLDLGKVFSDGLLSYKELMEVFAKTEHGMTGYAVDYPYYFYYCVVPWCAMYLWHQYEYSQDKEYLKNEAYPFFLKLCEFVTQLFEYDPADGYYHVYPDISPEQGPLAHDTTITVATCKYLLKFTLEAAAILGDSSALLDQCREILSKMPPYAVSEGGFYGPHLKDSPDAPDHMWIRHPSMLMPLFPIGEYDLNSDPEQLQILNNTLRFLEERSEIGIFGGSWLAASAARLGNGQMALRLLYERGIDHMLRANGLTAEETDHFINFCLSMRQPLYYPCMMEFTGEMLSAVNEMLLQSENGVIRVFPALPDGDPELYRSHMHGYCYQEYQDRFAEYPAWKDVRFDKLLAKGAFEVSASVKGGALEWIHILSKCGGTARVTSPLLCKGMKVRCDGAEIAFAEEKGVLVFETQPGKCYIISVEATVDTEAVQEDTYHEDVLRHTTYTLRNISIGEDPESLYRKQFDGFIRDWYLGNIRVSNHTVYKFDFGTDAHKRYQDIFQRQAFITEDMRVTLLPPVLVKDLQFTPKQGYGFADATGIETIDRGEPDGLRRDFAQGEAEAEFLIEVPRGQYELFAVSGDACEDSVTILDCEHGRTAGGELIRKGHYQCKVLPLVLEDDGVIRLKLSTKPGYRWKLNYLFLNCHKGY